jgi:hypothetical protein
MLHGMLYYKTKEMYLKILQSVHYVNARIQEKTGKLYSSECSVVPKVFFKLHHGR